MRIRNIALPATLVLATMACGHETKPPQTQMNAHDGVAITNAPQYRIANQGALSMSSDLRSVCGIEDTGTAPKFDFDSALLSSSDRNELDQLSKCMTTGPLTGKNVELTGRADPRGESEYNMNLGATRANAVKHYLSQLGIAPSRFTTTSRGSLDAQGHDDATWAVDRRVNLSLAGR